MLAIGAMPADNIGMGDDRAKPDIAVGDRVVFESAAGQNRDGRIVAIFDDYCTVETKLPLGREDIAFDRIRLIDRTERDAGRGFIL